MDTTLVKFLILWILYENIVVTTSMALKGIANEDANTRPKRSPANNFSLFGINLRNTVTAARNSFRSIGNLFSESRENNHQNNNPESIEPYGNVRIPNTISPIGFPNRSGIPNSRPQDDILKGERYVWPPENQNEGLVTSEPNKIQSTNAITAPERNYEAPASTGDSPGNGHSDQQLIDYIFGNSQFNSDSTTVVNNIESVTETGEYESTTSDLDPRIIVPQAAVASLLG